MGFIFRNNSRINDTQPIATSLRVQSSVQGQPIPVVHGQQRVAGNLIWYGNFNYTSGSGGGKGGKGGGGGGGKGSTGSGASYSASFMIGLCEGPVDAVLELWNNKTPQSLSGQGFSVFDGYQGQSPWGYLSGPEAIGYSNLAYTAVANYGLGNQPELPNFNFEVRGAISGAVTETYTVTSPYTFTPTYFSLLNSTVEQTPIPPNPYQYQAQNYGASTALPVILGTIPNPVGSTSAGVIDLLGNVFARVYTTPATGQYNVNASGVYTFAAADQGREVIVIDCVVSPGVSYVYQPTSSFGCWNDHHHGEQPRRTSLPVNSPRARASRPGRWPPGSSGTTVSLSLQTTSSESGVTLTFWGTALHPGGGHPGPGPVQRERGPGKLAGSTRSTPPTRVRHSGDSRRRGRADPSLSAHRLPDQPPIRDRLPGREPRRPLDPTGLGIRQRALHLPGLRPTLPTIGTGLLQGLLDCHERRVRLVDVGLLDLRLLTGTPPSPATARPTPRPLPRSTRWATTTS